MAVVAVPPPTHGPRSAHPRATRALVLALASLTLPSPAAAGNGFPAAEMAPDPPLEERLGESWRWRALDAPAQHAPSTGLHAWQDDGLLAAAAGTVFTYDGHAWTRRELWNAVAGFELRAVFPADDGLLLFTALATLFWDGSAPPVELCGRDDAPVSPCHTPDGRVVAGRGAGLVSVAPDGIAPFDRGPPGTSRVLGLAAAADGTLYVACDTGPWCRDALGAWTELAAGGGGEPLGRADVGELPVVVAGRRRVYFLPEAFDAHHEGYAWDGERLTRLGAHPRRVFDHVESAAVAPDDTLVIATRSSSLRLHDGSGWIDVEPEPLRGEYVRDLCFTGAGRLAVLSASGRMYVCDLRSTRWRLHDTEAEGGVSGSINALALDARDDVWVGTELGVARLGPEGFDNVWLEAGATGVPLRAITGLAFDAGDRLYAGSGYSFGGALVLEDGAWRHETDPDGVGLCHVHRIRRAPDGSVWFTLLDDRAPPQDGTAPGGLAVLRDGRWTRYTTADGLPDDRCYAVAFGADGSVYAGTRSGLARLHGERWQPLTEAGAPTGRIYALEVDGEGTLWVGQGSQDLGVSLRSGPHWRSIDSVAGRPLAAADIARHPDGGVMLASALGLYRAHGVAIDELSGPGQLAACNLWPVVVDGAGTVWTGSLGRGLLRYDPDDAMPPRLVTGPDVAWSADRGSVSMSWEGRDFWNVTRAGELRYSWRLDGGAWTEPTLRAWTSFDGVEAGLHTFELCVIDRAGNRSAPSALQFVSEPWDMALAVLKWALLAAGLLVAALAAFLLVRNRELSRARRLAHVLNVRLLSSQETEARRLSRDLHDDLGQVLTAIALELQLAQRADDAPRRDQALERALAGARDALQRVRRLSSLLRPRVLDELGLEDAVRSALADHGQRCGVEVRADVALRGPPLPAAVTGHLYRIVQEALTNSARHADARHVRLSLRSDGARVVLAIADDGKGFDVRRLPLERGVGLTGMRERAHLLGGRLTIRSRPGGGTHLVVTVPLDDGEERAAHTDVGPGARAPANRPAAG